MKRRLLSIILALCLTMSIVCVGIVPASADPTDPVETYAQETIRGSNILHCFDWSYNNIKAKLPEIAAAGYTAVQTSPVQSPKDYNSSWTDGVNQWWKLYQPLGFSVSNNTWLGTKAQLTSLCTEAEKYNIKVIVDIVANHLANNGTSGGTYSYLNSGVESDLKNANYYHTSSNGTNDNSRYNITQYHLGMPDLNTANTHIQQRVIGLLEECIDCGVDGFRFDAAKHIELPTDPSNCKSDFWPNVIEGAKDYASEKSLPVPFFYGEILGSPGPNCDVSNYTTYMAVTDNYTGDRALDKAYWSAASELADGTYYKGASADNSVLWVESHDTYMGNSGSAYFTNTKDVTSEVLNLAWAIVGARADSTALFFARPNSTMGAASTDTNWKSKSVTEVNKFKNHFDGTSEYLASSGNVAYIERGTKGVVISKLDGTSGSVNLTAHQMKSGSYIDQVTGNTFTVSNGKIFGSVGSTGVAVVYNADEPAYDIITTSTLYVKPSSSWLSSGGRYAMYLFNRVTGDNAWVSMTSDGNDYYSGSVPTGNWTNVIFCRMDGSNNTNNWDNKKDQTGDLVPDDNTNCYSVSSESWSLYGTSPTSATTATVAPTAATEAPSDTYTVYANNNAGWSNMMVYYWGSNTQAPTWPGVAMTQGNKVYKAEIPSDVTGIIFNDGASSNTKQTPDITSDIANHKEWVVTSTTSNDKYVAESGPTYYLVGNMNSWTNNNDYAFTLNTAETSKVEYKLASVTLPANAEIKVHDSKDTWYPSGENNNITVSAAGTYDVYFRPNADGSTSSGFESQKTLRLVNVTPCTVTWKDGDDNVLKTEQVPYGTTPSYTGDTPTKESTAQYTYTFSGWSPTPAAVTEDTTYTAQFTQSERTFTVTWKNYDGTTLETDENVAYGSKPQYDGETPTREAEGDTTYAFSGWSPLITDETTITDDTTYTARFGTNTNTYTITWKDGDGNTLRTEPCIQGVTPQYTGATPTKTATAQYTYTFNGTWDPPLVAADKDQTYTAQFDSTVNQYTIIFKNDDGTELQNSQVAYGETPAYTGETPTKAADANYTYTFKEWSPAIAPVDGAATYTAQFTATPIPNITVRATNVVEWNDVYIYYWTDFGDNSWPGVKMTADADNFIMTAEIPANAKGIVFTDGASSNTEQTVNITSGIADGAWWAILNTKDSTETSKYKVHAVHTYKLLGTMNNWTAAEAPEFVPHKASTKVEEYKLANVQLNENDEIKVYGSNDKWYPSGGSNNYTVTASGTYNVYFRPNADGGSSWHENVFYVKNVTPCTITWKDGDDKILKTDTVTYGETPAYTGETPTKTATDQYTYTFNNTWSPAITAATGDATYTAQFDSTVNKYTITFKNDDGTELQSTDVEYGQTPAYTGATPTKAASVDYTYTFKGWSPEITTVSGSATYTAQFTATERKYFSGNSLSLKGAIGVNFFIDLRGKSAANAVVTLSWYKYTDTVNLSDLTPEADGTYKVTCFVAAKEMNDTITATLTADGEVLSTDTYSVAEYAYRIIRNEDGEFNDLFPNDPAKLPKLQSLAKAMLRYGAEAQKFFGHNVDALADKDLGEYTPASIDNSLLTTHSYSGDTLADYGLTYAGNSLLLKNTTTLRLFFTADADFDGTEVFFNGTKLTPGTRGSYTYFDITGIKAADILKDQKLTFTKGDASTEVSFNIGDYIHDMQSDESLYPLLTGLYDYNRKAVAYFG